MTDVNWKKSIEKNKIVLNSGVSLLIFDKLLWSIFIIGPPAFSVLYTHMHIKEDLFLSSLLELIIINLISFWFAGVIQYRLRKVLTFIRVKGKTAEINKQQVIDLFANNNWNNVIDNDNYLIAVLPVSFRDSGKQITVLFDDTDILVNSITFGWFKMISPFHWHAGKTRLTKMIQDFTNN